MAKRSITSSKSKMQDITPNKYEQEWETFVGKINTYANDLPEKWNHYTLLSYFLAKYKEINDIEYIFTYTKKGPAQTKELRDAARIWKMFDKDRYGKLTTAEDKKLYKEQLVQILKDYITWGFDVKFHGRKTNITGLGIFVIANVMNEFLQWRKKVRVALPRRSDPLPKQFIAWLNDNAASIYKTQQLAVLGDLNALVNYVEAYNIKSDGIEVMVLNKAREMGIMPKTGKIELDKR